MEPVSLQRKETPPKLTKHVSDINLPSNLPISLSVKKKSEKKPPPDDDVIIIE